VGRRLALGDEPALHLGAAGERGHPLERGERHPPPAVVRREERLRAGQLEPAHPGLRVGHRLQDVAVGLARLAQPLGVVQPGVLQMLADDELDRHQGEEQRQQDGDARADAALHGLHLTRPAGRRRRWCRG
jgi:hypothetical protein